MKRIFFFLLICFAMNRSCGQVIAWDFIGINGDEVSIAPTTTDPRLTVSPITRGAGINASVLANAYSAGNWGAINLPAAIAADEYFQFSLQVNTGYQVSLSLLNANFRRSGTGPNLFQWQYSLDGFASAGSDMGPFISYTGTATAGEAQTPLNLAGISSLQDLPAGSVITVRLYGWGATALSGTFALGRLAGNDLSLGGSSIIVPVLLTSFNGYKDGSCNKLSWSTAAEINNLGFEMQRSADGVHYTAIGFVNSLAMGGNSSSPLNYSFIDNYPGATKQYYRLRQVDMDSRSKLSTIVLIKGDKPASLSIDGLFPNPAGSSVNMIIAVPGKDRVTILLTDMIGKILLQKVVEVETGSNTIPVDISRLNSGSYLVKLVCSNGFDAISAKFIKQ